MKNNKKVPIKSFVSLPIDKMFPWKLRRLRCQGLYSSALQCWMEKEEKTWWIVATNKGNLTLSKTVDNCLFILRTWIIRSQIKDQSTASIEYLHVNRKMSIWMWLKSNLNCSKNSIGDCLGTYACVCVTNSVRWVFESIIVYYSTLRTSILLYNSLFYNLPCTKASLSLQILLST